MQWDYTAAPTLDDPVVITDFDPRWPALFRQERARILDTLGPVAAGVEHIGSTAVPGLAAKPVLDILIGVTHLPLAEGQLVALAALGYEYRGVRDDESGQFFRTDPRTRHLRVVPFDGAEWRRCLAFRDHLRANPDVAGEYAALKRDLAQRYPHNRERYGAGKHAFIQDALRQALAHGPDLHRDGVKDATKP